MYYYHNGKQEVGPFDVHTLRKLQQSGIIAENTLARHTDSSDWGPFGQLLDSVTTDQGGEPDEAEQTSDMHSEPVSPVTESDPPSIETPIQSETTVMVAPNGWLAHPPTPWRRYAARILDSTFNGLIFMVILAIGFFAVAPATADIFFSIFEIPGGRFLDMMLTTAAASVLGGSLIGVSGSTLGKFIFGVKVTRTDG